MHRLRTKSVRLTEYLQFLLDSAAQGRGLNEVRVITPRQASEHGCQLSICVEDRPKERFNVLQQAGVKCDFREPNVIRAAPTPLYNSFHEVWRFATLLSRIQ